MNEFLKDSERPDWLRIPGVVELSQIRSRARQQVCGQGADRSTGNRIDIAVGGGRKQQKSGYEAEGGVV